MGIIGANLPQLELGIVSASLSTQQNNFMLLMENVLQN